MFTLPNRPQTAIDIVINGFRFWKKSIWSLSLLVLFAVVLGSLPSFLFQELNTLDPALITKVIEENIIFYVLYLVFILYLFGVILYRANLLMYQQKGNFISALWVGLKRLPYLIIALLIFDVVFLIGFVLFIIPGIAAAIYLSMYFVLVITDGENPIKAFKHSWQLVTDNWWRTFAVMITTSATLLLLAFCVDIIAADLWTMTHPSGGTIAVGHHLLRMLVGFLFYPFLCSILLILRHDLKLRKGEL